MAELPDDRVALVGEQVAERPMDGLTDHVRLSEPANPLRLVRVTVDVPDEPIGNVTVEGLAVTLKSGGAITLTEIVAEWVREPDVPVMVTV